MADRKLFQQRGSRNIGNRGISLDTADMDLVVDDFIPNITLRAARRMANTLRSNPKDKPTPVQYGFLRSRWEGSRTAITNDADYSEPVEVRIGGRMEKYVRKNMQGVLDGIADSYRAFD